MTTKPVRVGIIGTGGISRLHALAYGRIPDVEIVAVADIMPERAERAAQEWNVPRWFGNVQQLLEQDLDAVSVCTFNQAHREPTIAALEAGKHVLLEKPMAANLDDAIAMTRAAKASGKIFHVGFWPRWQPEIQAAKRMVEDGALGELYYAQMVGGGRRRIPPGSFLRKAFAGAGPTVDIGCYDLDTFVFLAGAPRPVSVSAMVSYRLGKNLPNVPGDWGHDPTQVEVEDMGTAFVRFENGLVLHFTTYWAAHADDMGPNLLLGTKGGLQLTPRLTLFRDEFGVLTNVSPQLPDRSEPNRQHHFVPQAQRFIAAVRAGGPSPIDPREVLLSQVIMDGMFRSAEAGREVEVQVPVI